jgi:hypothetical protein
VRSANHLWWSERPSARLIPAWPGFPVVTLKGARIEMVLARGRGCPGAVRLMAKRGAGLVRG